MSRRIYPIIAVATEDGYRRMTDDEVETVVASRREEPNGPVAPSR